MDQVLIPCKMCEGTGLGNYPNECYQCNGTGVASQYGSTQVMQWFKAIKEELEKRDLEILKLKEEAGDMRKVIAALVMANKDEFTRDKLIERIDGMRCKYHRTTMSEEVKMGDKDLYELVIGDDDYVNIKFTDSSLTIEEEIAKDIIE